MRPMNQHVLTVSSKKSEIKQRQTVSGRYSLWSLRNNTVIAPDDDDIIHLSQTQHLAVYERIALDYAEQIASSYGVLASYCY